MTWSDQIVKYQRVPPPEFELDAAYTLAGITKNEKWAITETLRERHQTATPELIWYWAQKLRNRERIGA